MTKLFVTRNGDVATIGYESGRLNKDVEFELTIRFPDNPALDTINVHPSYAVAGAPIYRFIRNNRFTIPKTTTKWFVQVQFNNIPNTIDDARIEVGIKVLTTGTNITNPNGLKVTIDAFDEVPTSVITADAQEETIPEGRTGAYVHYTLSRPLALAAPVTVTLTPSKGTLASVASNFQYSFNGVVKAALPGTREIELPQDCENLYVFFDVKTNMVMLDDLDLKVSLTKPTAARFLVLDKVEKTFHIKDITVLPPGTLIKRICKGFTSYGVFSDGTGSTYETLIEENARECGWLPPAAGTVLEEYCAGVNKMLKKADGNGGYTVEVKTTNDVACGYVPRVPNNQGQLTPTKFDQTSGTTKLSPDKLDFYALNRDAAKSAYGAMFGKWYWEVTVSFPTATSSPIAIGLATSTHGLANWIGSNNQSWGWWIYQSTFYFNNLDKPYGVPIQDGDVISVIFDADLRTLEFWVNGVSQGIASNTLPVNTKLYAVVNATNESYASANYGQWEWEYPPPPNTYPGFGVLNNPPIERGVIIREFCDGTTRMGEYADGRFGSYNAIIKAQDPTCGYNPIPPLGTLLGTVCQGFDQYNRIADGFGGETLALKTVNATACGYVPPPTPAHAPTKLDAIYSDGTPTILTNNQLTAQMSGAVRSEYSAYSGRWYWEVLVTSDLTHVGIGIAGALKTNYVGKTDKSWGWSVKTKELVHDDDNKARIPFNHPVQVGDVIGVALNFVQETLTFYINGVLAGEAFTGLTGTYFAMASNSSAAGTAGAEVTFNFGGPSGMGFTPPLGHIAGYGTPTTVYTKKGTYYTYRCEGTTKVNRYHDGGGGYYDGLRETNSTTCGWKPPLDAGTFVKDICVGIALYKQYADGNYGFYETLVEPRSVLCGYKPYGALLSSRCDVFDKYNIYSDGEGGNYEQLVESNSVTCGYGGGSGSGGDTPPIDETLVESVPEALVFTVRPKPLVPGTMIVPLK